MLKHYFKIAWRNALKHRNFTLISLSSLVLGITLFFFISLWAKDELGYDKDFYSPEQLFRVEMQLITSSGSSGNNSSVGWPVGKHLAQYPDIEKVTYLRNWVPVITYNRAHFYEDAIYADENFFGVFGYRLQQGDTATALDAPYSVVISEAMKEKYFNKENPVGKVLLLNDTVPYTVTGVFENLPANSHMQFEMVGSFATFCAIRPKDCEQEFASGWFDMNVYNYVRLRKTANRATVESKIKDIVQQAGHQSVAATGFKGILSLRPVEEIYLYSGMPTMKGPVGSSAAIKLFLAIGLIILLIACLNFINLTTAKSIDRAKEVGIQKVLGNTRRYMVLQFLTETAFLCGIAAIISIILMIALLPLFNEFTGKTFTAMSLASADNILLLLLILTVLVPLAGFYPAWVLSSFKPITVLKGIFSHTGSGNALRKGLVIVQFVISAGFIMSTMIMWKQMRYMRDKDLGFNKENILLVDANKVPWTLRHERSARYKNSLLQQTGIQFVTACNAVPGRDGWNGQFAYPEGRTVEEVLSVEYISVDTDYVKTIGLQLLAGRDFLPGSKKDEEESFIINETAVRTFGWGNAANALGKKLSTSGKDGRIVGVMKDYHQHGLQEKVSPIVLSPIGVVQLFAIRYQGIPPEQVIAGANAAWTKAFEDYPIEYRFLEEDFQRQYRKEAKQQNFFGLAAILSVVIGSLGLMGLAIYTAQKRVKEIGVRKVLGAGVAQIVGLLSKDLLLLVMIAVIIAVPIAWWTMYNWLENFAFRVSIGWLIFLVAGVAALLIAMLTISFHAIKAALANPVRSLRTE